MKYELSREQVEGLLQIIDAAPISGKAAEFVVVLKQTLRNPIEEKKDA